MSTIIQENGKFRLICKGASEIVLGLCDSVATSEGIVPLTPEFREELEQRIHAMAEEGLRTLCLAYKDMVEEDPTWDQQPPEHSLICLGIVGIKVNSSLFSLTSKDPI